MDGWATEASVSTKQQYQFWRHCLRMAYWAGASRGQIMFANATLWRIENARRAVML